MPQHPIITKFRPFKCVIKHINQQLFSKESIPIHLRAMKGFHGSTVQKQQLTVSHCCWNFEPTPNVNYMFNYSYKWAINQAMPVVKKWLIHKKKVWTFDIQNPKSKNHLCKTITVLSIRIVARMRCTVNFSLWTFDF